MWAQSWTQILDLTLPYEGRSPLDVTDKMKREGYTPLRLFRIAEQFFTSLGLDRMTFEFWERSLFEKPTNRRVVCHASAWDFCDGKDFR